MKTRIAAIFALAALGGGCLADDTLGTEELDVAQDEIDLIDVDDAITILPSCTSVAPHKTIYYGPGYNVPYPPYYANSSSARYFYEGCGRFVADVYVGSSAQQAILVGTNFDLPSASADDLYGSMPNNAIDCDEYRQHVTIWHKKGTGAFVEKKKGSYKGVWNGSTGKCHLSLYSGVHPSMGTYTTAGAGWDVFRVAVSVKERRSGQTAAVGLELVPPS